MKTYLYRGPTSGVSFDTKNGERIERMLFDGREVDLPDDHDVTQALITKGHLSLVNKPKAAKAAAKE